MSAGALRDGVPRILGNHHGRLGRSYRKAYLALAERFGPLPDQVAKMECSRAAAAWVEYEASLQALTAARIKLNGAKGRYAKSWSPQAVQRLSKRVGLNDSTYSAAVRRLEELTARTREHAGPRDLSHLLTPSTR
jgi:hypothetical protein